MPEVRAWQGGGGCGGGLVPAWFRTVRAGVGIGWRQRPQELTGRRVVAERLRATEPDWV